MKERDPFTGSLFEVLGANGQPSGIVLAIPNAEISTEPLPPDALAETISFGNNSAEIARLTSQPRADPDSRFCMVHMKWERDVAIYIDGKRPLFLCPAVAAERGAWKWEGKWPEGK